MLRALARLATRGLFVAPVLLLARVASAQDAAAADAQFQRGVAAMQKGDLETACPAIAESQRLDPRPGTLFTLAECEAKRGRVATAWQHYADYLAHTDRLKGADRQRHEERRGLATKKQAELSAKIPKLTLSLPAGATDVEVRRDGTLLGAASLGVALPVDPGERKVVVRTKDGREAAQFIRVAEGESKSVTLEVPAAAPAKDAPKDAPPTATERRETPKKGGAPTAAWVVGGVGVAGFVVSGVTGAMVFGKKGTMSDHCVDGRCDRQGKEAADSAKSLATVSTVAFAVGVVGVGVSAWMFSSAKKEDPAVAVGVTPLPRGAALGASGRF